MEILALIAIAIGVAALAWFFLNPRARRSRAAKPQDSRPATAEPPPVAPRPFDHNVQFTVYRPQQVEPQRWYSLLAFVHLTERRPDEPDAPDPIAEVARQAARLVEDEPATYTAVVGDSVHAIPRSGELTLVPHMDGIEFNPAQCAVRWEQPVHRVEFHLRALSGSLPRTARGRLTILLGPVIVGDVPLAISVVASVSATTSRVAADTARPYRNIFASYSHRDVDVVQDFDEVIETLGDRYLRDVRDLRTGQVWSEELERLIERADVFQLFWSWNALASPLVQQEWEFALRLQRPNFIRPVYWEEPLPARGDLPPDTLRRLHFHRLRRGDVHQATERAPGPARAAPARKPWLVGSSTALTAAAATILVATLAWPLLRRASPGVSDSSTPMPRPAGEAPIPAPPSPAAAEPPSGRRSGGVTQKPAPVVPPPSPELPPSPSPTTQQQPLARVRIPRDSLVDGRPLAAGTYEIALATGEHAAGSEPPSEQWVEFRRNGRSIGREIATVVPPSEIAAVLKGDRPKPGQARVSLLKGDDYMRVWFNQRGTHYLVHLPLR